MLPESLTPNKVSRGQVRPGSTPLVNRRAPTRADAIEPALLHGAPVYIRQPSTGSMATRPPVVGREHPLDPKRSERYSSSDAQLKEYLKTLQGKTVVEDPRLSDVKSTSNNFCRFLKKPLPTTEQPTVPAIFSPQIPTTNVLSTRSTSSALQKALVLTSKLTKSTSIKKATSFDHQSLNNDQQNAEKQETIDRSNDNDISDNRQLDEFDVDPSSSVLISVGSFLNIRDFDDLELSDVPPEVPVGQLDKSEIPSDDGLVEILRTESNSITTLKSIEKSSLNASDADKTITSEITVLKETSTKSTTTADQEAGSSSASYSDDFEETQTNVTQSSTEIGKSEKVLKYQTASKAVQTIPFDVRLESDFINSVDSTTIPRNRGIPSVSFADPRQISSFVISQDILNRFSSYNPSMVALDELFRQQVRNTRSFVTAQRCIYNSIVDSLKNDHKYTTLSETQRVIAAEKNRRMVKSTK